MADEKHAGGRPTKYRKEMCEQATRLCLLGAKDSELAAFFEVSEATLYNWRNEHPEFLEALSDGKENADAAVAKSLYQQALSGNTTAQIFWLKNRRKRDWRDKQEIDHTSGGEKIEPTRIVFTDGAAKD